MKYLDFKINKSYYALNIENVVEILNFQKVNKIVGSNKNKIGIVKIRDNVYNVIDLKHLIYQESSLEKGFFIIVQYEDKKLALLVENVCSINEIDDNDLKEIDMSMKDLNYDMLDKIIMKDDELSSL